jgi:hypothetical protein
MRYPRILYALFARYYARYIRAIPAQFVRNLRAIYTLLPHSLRAIKTLFARYLHAAPAVFTLYMRYSHTICTPFARYLYAIRALSPTFFADFERAINHHIDRVSNQGLLPYSSVCYTNKTGSACRFVSAIQYNNGFKSLFFTQQF